MGKNFGRLDITRKASRHPTVRSGLLIHFYSARTMFLMLMCCPGGVLNILAKVRTGLVIFDFFNI